MLKLQSARGLSIWALLAISCGAALLIGCGSDPEPMSMTPETGVAVDAATKGGDFSAPRDSVPTSNGDTIYFVAKSSTGPGLFSVPGSGGAAKAVATGGEFKAPIGVALGSDDKNAYVADTEAGGMGEILVVNLESGVVTVLNGTAGTAASAVTVAPGAAGDTVYYTGVNSMNQEPAVFSISPGGAAAPTVIASGAPLVQPSGIAVTSDGTVYVADQRATDAMTGKVYSISSGSGSVTPIVDSVITGDPAGITFTKDESTLLVSSIDKTAHDQVLLVTLPTYETSIFNAVIGANTAGGGVHRAAGANIFSWCDLSAGTAGTVYRIELK